MMKQQSLNLKSVTILQGQFSGAVLERLSKNGNYFVMEGRPRLESAKRTIRELQKRKIEPTVIADNMAGFLFAKDYVKDVVVAYQAKDKDGALCQIGGLILAVLAKRHKVPFSLKEGKGQLFLLGEQREIFEFNGERVAPRGIQGYVPLVEWIPRKYITRIN